MPLKVDRLPSGVFRGSSCQPPPPHPLLGKKKYRDRITLHESLVCVCLPCARRGRLGGVEERRRRTSRSGTAGTDALGPPSAAGGRPTKRRRRSNPRRPERLPNNHGFCMLFKGKGPIWYICICCCFKFGFVLISLRVFCVHYCGRDSDGNFVLGDKK